MNKPITPAHEMIVSREDWIKHFVDLHTQMPGTPSPDEMRKYPRVLMKMIKDHSELHTHFYAGHEHKYIGNVGMVIPGRTK